MELCARPTIEIVAGGLQVRTYVHQQTRGWEADRVLALIMHGSKLSNYPILFHLQNVKVSC